MGTSDTVMFPTGPSLRAGSAAQTVTAVSTWPAHAPFLGQLVAGLRPRLIVDLDGDDGASGFAEICAKPAALAGARVLSGAEALTECADPVDCLNLGNARDAEDAQRRWDLWRPRLSADAVVLVPGLSRGADSAEMHRFFLRCAGAFQAFAFTHHGGLGVVALGAPPLALATFFSPGPDSQALMNEIYDHIGQKLCAPPDAALERRIVELEALIRRLDGALAQLKLRASSSDDRRDDAMRARMDALAARLEARALAPSPPPAASALSPAVEARLAKAERRIARLNWHAAVLMPLTGPLVLILRYVSRKIKKIYRKWRPRR